MGYGLEPIRYFTKLFRPEIPKSTTLALVKNACELSNNHLNDYIKVLFEQHKYKWSSR